MEFNSEDLNNIANMIENNCKTEKNSSCLLMKQKMWKTHDLIKQYSEKVKEIASLKLDLEITKKEAMHITLNSKSAIDKVTELKHNMMDIEEENKKLKSKRDEYEINIAAYEQTVQQLKCKIEKMGEDHDSKTMEYDLQKKDLEDKIKSLECNLKQSKLMLKKKEKKITSVDSDMTKLVSTTIKSTTDVGINVSLCDSELNTKPKVQDISIMTDEFYNTKDNPYPLFCSKCETYLPPTVTPEKICRAMNAFPELIDGNLSSPSKKILPSYLSYDTYSDSTNKCEDAIPFELSTSRPSPYNNEFSDPMIAHLKSQLSHSFGKTQNSENELKGSNACAMHVPVATNISTNPCCSSAKLILSENIDYMKKYSYTTDSLLARHTSHFKKIQRKLKSLKRKMKKLRRSQKKRRPSPCCHHCVTNGGASLNSDLLSTIFKCVAQCYDEKRDNERKIESEKYRKNTAEKIQVQKRKRSDAYNVSENPFSSRCENLEENTSIQEEDTPIQKEDTQIQEEDTFMQEEDTSMQEEDTPMQEEVTPMQEESTPMQEEGTPMQEENIPIQEKDTLIQEEDILIQEEDTSIQEEDTSIQEEDTSIKEEDTPIQEEDTPIQEEDIPIQEEDTSIQEEDTSIQKEDILAQDTIEEDWIKDTICDKFEEVTKETDILHQSLHTSCVNKSTPTLNVNAANVFFNSTDQSGEKALVARGKHVSISAQEASLEDSERKSHSSSDEICTSNNLSSESDVESVNGAVMETTCLSSNDDDKNCDKRSIDRAKLDRKIHIIAEKSKMKGNNQNKEKLNSRLLKNIRNLKRKTQTGRINKQEDIASGPNHSSEHNKLAKRPLAENKNETDNRIKQIRNLKRNLETRAVSSTNMQEDSTKESDTELYSEPPKKRIAHVPRTLPVFQLSINQQQDFTHHMIKNIANLEASRQKCGRIQRLGTPIQKNSLLIKNEKNNAINKNDEKNSVECTKARSIDQKSTSDKCQGNFALPVTNNEQVPTISEFNKDDDVSIEDGTDENVSMERGTTRTSINCEEADAQAKTIEPRKVITPAVELHSYNTIEDKCSDDRETLKNMNMNMNNELTSNRLATLEVMRYKSRDISDKISKVRHLPLRSSANIIEDCVDDNNTEESFDKVRSIIGTREKVSINNGITGIQAIETRMEDTCLKKRNKKMKSIHHVDVNDVEEPQAPMFPLMEHVKKRIVVRKRPNKNITYIRKLADKFVKIQLVKLRDNSWKDSVHCDITQKLNDTCGPRIIAKCIVEFLSENVHYKENLDKSFTPPAPLMTAFEQKIIALLVDLERSKPKTIHFVQAAIEYKLFRLTNEVKVQVESLTRIYVVLSRIQKDRERVRIMCCNALYCLGFKSINVIYTILTCWPEVLPNAETNKGILPKCIAFLIDSQDADEANKLNTLKLLISRFYKYSFAEITINNIVAELMNALKAEKTDDGLETAIILLAKRKKPSWAYQNIIKSNLLPMIINHELPCVYSAFSLLGKLMRPFPLEDKDHVVRNISEQLRDLIQSGQGSDDQQEGIISALLSLSRHEFDTVAQCVVNWRPNKSLRPTTVTQLEGFINTRNAKFWKLYLQKKYPK